MKDFKSINKKNALLSVASVFIVFALSLLLIIAFEFYKASNSTGNGIEKTISDLKKITDSTNVAAKDLNIEILRSNFDFADATLKKWNRIAVVVVPLVLATFPLSLNQEGYIERDCNSLASNSLRKKLWYLKCHRTTKT